MHNSRDEGAPDGHATDRPVGNSRRRPVRTSGKTRAIAAVLFSAAALSMHTGHGAESGPPAAHPPSAVRAPVLRESPHFTLHTDLPADKADALLQRMEATLSFAAECWKRPPRGRIECYVAQDIRNWPDYELPNPAARVIVKEIGGVTFGRKSGAGKSRHNTAVIYASTAPGVAEHEVMHAYCAQTFGELGPTWYKEGMAEMAVLGHGELRRDRERLLALRNGTARSIRDVLSAGEAAKQLTSSLNTMISNRGGNERQVSTTAWTAQDADSFRLARQDCLQSWALCYLLYNNPNYSQRFQSLGSDYLTKRDVTFEQLFAPMAREVSFEYGFFLQHIDTGYRVDLCRWDWHRRQTAQGVDDRREHYAAARGWQASDISVSAGRRYSFDAAGQWSTSADRPATDADGDAAGNGRLVAVVMQDFSLGDSFSLGRHGEFVAPQSGRLYLRCQDAWNELSDNCGQMRLHIQPLPNVP